MEGEMNSVIVVFLIVAASLSYCYFISMSIQKGVMRLLSFLPVICIFSLLPFLVSSVLLKLGVGLLFAWLANFKLLLLAFGSDDRSSRDSLLNFILITALPVKMSQIQGKKSNETWNNLNAPLTCIIQALLWCFTVQIQVKKPYSFLAKPIGSQFLFCLRMLLSIQLGFTVFGVLAKKILKCELEPQFNNPHLSTSLQNLWGKRWNRMTSGILRSSVYTPTRSLFTPVIGRRWARYLAILTTFTVSGLMHEILYMYAGLDWPTWDVTWFFIIHGVCVATEIEVKEKALEMAWVLHPMISWLLTLGFFIVTNTWLCSTELVRAGIDTREIENYVALVYYVKSVLPILN